MRFRICISSFYPVLDTSAKPTNRRVAQRKAQISCAKNQNVFYVIYALAQRGVSERVSVSVSGRGRGGSVRIALQCRNCGTPLSGS